MSRKPRAEKAAVVVEPEIESIELPDPRPAGKRMLLVLPKETISAIQIIAGKLNATYSSVVHMAIMRFVVEDEHLRHHAALEQYLTKGASPQQREGG